MMTIRGQLILCTSGMKTLCGAEVARQFVGDNGVVVVVAPRIGLVFQLLGDYVRHLRHYGEVRIINVNSGNMPQAEINELLAEVALQPADIESTILPRNISDFYNHSHGARRIVGATYDSCWAVLESGIPLDLIVFDEAHYLSNPRFFELIGRSLGNVCVPRDIAKAVLFQTATPSVGDSSIGMCMRDTHSNNNETIYGPVLYTRSVRHMEEAGIICRPAVHLVRAAVESASIDDSIINQAVCIADAFTEHDRIVGELSDGCLGAKLLVAINGNEPLRGLFSPRVFLELTNRLPTGTKIFAQSCEFGAYVNGNYYETLSDERREEITHRISNADDREKIVLIHIDTWTVGLNIPGGLTGMMPFPSFGATKFAQNFGRSWRRDRIDRKKIDDGTIGPTDYDKMRKPYAWAVIPAVMSHSPDTTPRYLEIIQRMLSDYEYSVGELMVVDSRRGIADNDEIPAINQLNRHQHLGPPDIIEYFHNIEDLKDYDNTASFRSLVDLYRKFGDCKLSRECFASLGYTYSWEVFERRAKSRIAKYASYDQEETGLQGINQGVFKKEIIDRFGCVFTDQDVVIATNDILWARYNQKPKLDATYIDASCGDGNYLIDWYRRLMLEPSEMHPVNKSLHILTRCLYGIEIIEEMWGATQIRLITAHGKTIKQHSGDVSTLGYDQLVAKLNIKHANTLLTSDDNMVRLPFEGGLLTDDWRSMEWDLIGGNPPYNDMCLDGNVRRKVKLYSSYPHYADLAQCFIRWSYDHLTEDGICALNTADSWLNDKKIGNAHTKRLLFDKLIEIVQTNKIKTYSADGAGKVNTMVFAFQKSTVNKTIYRHDTGAVEIVPNLIDILEINFLRRHGSVVAFQSVPLTTYCEFSTIRNEAQQEQENWQNIVLDDNFDTLIFGYVLTPPCTKSNGTFLGGFKLSAGAERYASKTWKLYGRVIRPIALWVIGYLNTTVSLRNARIYGKELRHAKGVYRVRFGVDRLSTLPVPDYDWYLTNRPEQTKAFLTWVEDNMRDKDKFLSGIDEAFERLLNELV